MASWRPVIGLEIHAQISSLSKLFSPASTAFMQRPNSQVTLFDAATPGTLPRANVACVDAAIATSLALGCRVNERSFFDRKHYFYRDSPLGYQITQKDVPIGESGELRVRDGAVAVGIERVQLETDTGKTVAEVDRASGFDGIMDRSEVYRAPGGDDELAAAGRARARTGVALLDLNRAGVGLMEIVTTPSLTSAEDAGAFLRALQFLLQHIGACDGNMEEGSLRCDVNVSVSRDGSATGQRCEVKNLNSVRGVMRAIEFETQRQIALLEAGGTVEAETRAFDAATSETRRMRGKDTAIDYRFMRDPNLPPLVVSPDHIDAVRASLPEMPDEMRRRLRDAYGLDEYTVGVLIDAGAVAFYEAAMAASQCGDGKRMSNWLTSELLGRLSGLQTLATSPVDAARLAQLVDLVAEGTISGKIGKQVLDVLFAHDAASPVPFPLAVVDEHGWRNVTDVGELEAQVDALLASMPDKIAEYRAGKEKLFGFFVGQMMKVTRGQANPQALNDVLRARLKG